MNANFECDHCHARFPTDHELGVTCPRCAWPLAPRTSPPLPKPPPSRRVAAAATTCPECGCLLPPGTFNPGGTCGYFRCAAKFNARAANIHRETYEQRVAKVRAAIDAPIPERVAFLPVNEKTVVPIGDERRAALRTHLEQLVVEAREQGHPTPTQEAFQLDPLLGTACAVCEGACCAHGADRAYLDARTLARLFVDDRDRPLEEVVELYLSHVGEASYEGTCIYHGARGCTLPRTLRAEVCNTYQCPGLRSFSGVLKREDDEALVVSGRGPTPVRLAVIDDRGEIRRMPVPAALAEAGTQVEPPKGAPEPPPWLGALQRIAAETKTPWFEDD